jgi:hypothetical protein
MKNQYLLLLFLFISQVVVAQTILEADGPGNTYELINSVLAPNYDAVEEPDCNHSSFGRHIDEVFDTDLNKYVFRFHIHTSPDNDRCLNFDRQRNEIKSYDKSPDSLKAVLNEKVQYKWKFKLDSLFQPSAKFTHIHQIKAVGGTESSMPLVTLTPRKSNPDRLELRYAEALSQTTLHQVPLAPFLGVWVEATETILYQETGLGQYDIVINDISTGNTLFSYSNSAIRMWKTGADFQRPKWGVYRSLEDSTNLRDEEVLFADFSIDELIATSLTNYSLEDETILVYPNPANHRLILTADAFKKYDKINIYNNSGQLVLARKIETDNISIAHLDAGTYFIHFEANGIRTKAVKVVVK